MTLLDDPLRTPANSTGTQPAAGPSPSGPSTPPVPPASSDTYSIAEVSERMGLSPHSLRYYERVGLLEVARDSGGRRVYDANDLYRIKFITCLRSTSLPIRQLQRYFDLVDAGPDTQAERLALLEDHRKNVLAQLADMESALATIEFKIDIYGGTNATS